MNFTTRFTLDRQHLLECYEQSLPHNPPNRLKLGYIAMFTAAGIILLNLDDTPGVFGALFIGLGIIEVLSWRFHRPWWLARQLLSRSANCEVELSINEEGINSKSPYFESKQQWSDFKRIIDTDKGFILLASQGGQSYLSKSILSPEALEYMKLKLSDSPEEDCS